MTNGGTVHKELTVDWRVAAAESAIKNAPYAILLGLVLWFVGTNLVSLGQDLIKQGAHQNEIMGRNATAIDKFADALNGIEQNNIEMMQEERREHKEFMQFNQEFLAFIKLVSQKRDQEISLLREVVTLLRDQNKD